jgi:hypothetical protein
MANEPIAPTAEWTAAVEAADGQCEGRTGAEKRFRCTRTLRGGHRLYLGTDGHVYCPDCWDRGFKPVTPRRGKAPADDTPALF